MDLIVLTQLHLKLHLKEKHIKPVSRGQGDLAALRRSDNQLLNYQPGAS